MKIRNVWNVPNQFEIVADNGDVFFQSYNSVIAKKSRGKITLGKDWDYSKTTSKYRNLFLHETKKETEAKLKSGEYTLDETL